MREDRFFGTDSRWTRWAAKLESSLRLPQARGDERLIRPRYPRKLAGVCSGLAAYYAWNVTVFRILAILLAIASTGIVIVAYAAAWVLIPEGQYRLVTGTPTQTGTSPS